MGEVEAGDRPGSPDGRGVNATANERPRNLKQVPRHTGADAKSNPRCLRAIPASTQMLDEMT